MALGRGSSRQRGALYSSGGGATWRPENGRDLKFEASVVTL